MTDLIFPKVSRYDYVLVWGHGLPFTEIILDMIREIQDLEILHIKEHITEKIKTLVDRVYDYDYAPRDHLESKTRYLMKTSPKVIFIFIKNNDADEYYVGEGAYKHIESQKIRELKEKVRNRLNPRGATGERTENHVIHASDNELQTDYILKYLGYKEGVNIFKAGNPIFPHPWYLGAVKSFLLQMIPMYQVRCLINSGGKILRKDVESTPHLQAIIEKDFDIYSRYYDQYKYKTLCSDYSCDQFKKLIDTFDYLKHPYEGNYIILKKENHNFVVLDGLHRIAIMKSRNVEEFIGMTIK